MVDLGHQLVGAHRPADPLGRRARLAPDELRRAFQGACDLPLRTFASGAFWWTLGGVMVAAGMKLRYDDFGAFSFAVMVAAASSGGLVTSLFNAFLVVYLRLPSLIATIGTLTFYRGLAQVLAGDASIKFPEWYMGLNLVTVLGIPVPDLIVALASHSRSWPKL